jgi:hypothetical protein
MGYSNVVGQDSVNRFEKNFVKKKNNNNRNKKKKPNPNQANPGGAAPTNSTKA